MAKAQMKMATGTQVVIEGTQAEVARILSLLDESPRLRAAKGRVARLENRNKEKRKESTIKDVVVLLKEKGFFRKPKGLREIREELENEGHLVPVTTLSGVMLALVQRKELRRVRKEGVWVYGER